MAVALLFWTAPAGLLAKTLVLGDTVETPGVPYETGMGLSNGATPQTGQTTLSGVTASGDLTISLKVETSDSLSLGNDNLRVQGGSRNNRIDSGNSWSDSADDEWIEFSLTVSGPAAGDLSSIALAGLVLSDGGTAEVVEYSDSMGNSVLVPGNGTRAYTVAGGLQALTPLSLANVGGRGDGTWSLRLTARDYGTEADPKTTTVRVRQITLDYQLVPPEPATLPQEGLVLHLDAGRITGVNDGAPLTGGWEDATGSGRIATSPSPPSYRADGGGGYPVVRFDGSDDFLQTAFPSGPQMTVFAVYANRRENLQVAHGEPLLSTSSATTPRMHLGTSRYLDEPAIVQFGWDTDDFFDPAYVTQIGADEIIEWTGLDSMEGGVWYNQGVLPNLNNEPEGASMSSPSHDVLLTSRTIQSSDSSRTHTNVSNHKLGIGPSGGDSTLYESSADAWSFDFDREVELRQVLLNGLNLSADNARITIEGGPVYTLTLANTLSTFDWSGSHNLRLFTLPTPVNLPAGRDITIEAIGSSSPENNFFSVGAIIVAVPAVPPDYPGFVAAAGSGISVETHVNGLATAIAGTDTFPGRFVIGSATYMEVPTGALLTLGAEDAAATEFGKNDLRELLIYDTALSAQEREEVLTYLGEKYRIDADPNPLEAPWGSFIYILGAQQIGRHPNFGESGFLVLDAARTLYRQGARVFKLSLSNTYAFQNGVPKNPSITNLTELVRDEPTIREVFDMPWKDLLFWCTSFSVPKFGQVSTLEGLSAADEQKIYDEIYVLTVHLLTTYNGSGRRFYLGNWEGDWLLAGTGSQNPEADITPEKIAGMIDWARVRQQAIDDAKSNTPHSDVEVWYYLEMNRGDWAVDGRPCIVNSVMPHLTKLDMVSFSAYSVGGFNEADTHNALTVINTALPPLNQQLPSYLNPSGSRLILGEYGYWQGTQTEAQQVGKYIDKIRQYLSWSAGPPRFILMWQLYFDENNPETGQPKNMHMIGPDNLPHALYYLHENYYTAMRRWVKSYYDDNGELPSVTATATKASEVIGSVSLGELVPDLSDPIPYTVTFPANQRFQIPPPEAGQAIAPLGAAVTSPYGRFIEDATMDYTLLPEGNGVTIDSAGNLQVDELALPGNYSIEAAVTGWPGATATGSATVTLPVASIYDTLDDFSHLSGSTASLSLTGDNAATRFEGDSSRLRRTDSLADEPVIWNLEGLKRFYAKVYFRGDLSTTLSADVSTDGTSWQTVTLRLGEVVPTADSWQRSWVGTVDPLPAGTNFLRFMLSHPTEAYNPQIGEVVLLGHETGYDFWKSLVYTDPAEQSDPAISGPTADPGNFGLPNLMRYAFGLENSDPAQWHTYLPYLETVDGEGVFRFRLDPTKLDLRWRVWGSTDLSDWPYLLFDSASGSPLSEGGWTETATSSMPADEPQFLRLELSQ
jgi:hypothetical protein